MGMFDWVPCCGPRSREEKDTASITDNAPLIAPQREGSILSADVAGMNYGAVDNAPPSGGLTGEQRARIEEIGRQVGNSMLPIHNTTRSPHLHKPHTTAQHSYNHTSTSIPSSVNSSRPSSPSPMRRGPGMMTPEQDAAGGAGGKEGAKGETISHKEGNGESGEGAGQGEGAGMGESVEVVQKRLFVGGGGGGGGGGGRGGRKGRGRGKGKGRGRGK